MGRLVNVVSRDTGDAGAVVYNLSGNDEVDRDDGVGGKVEEEGVAELDPSSELSLVWRWACMAEGREHRDRDRPAESKRD